MPRRKSHRISHPVRRAARAFSKFADRLASLIASEVQNALQVAVAELEKVKVGEVQAVPEAAPRQVRRHRRAVSVQIGQAAAPQAHRKRGRPPKVNLLASMEPAVALVDPLPAQVAAAPAVEPVNTSVNTPPVIIVKVLPRKIRRRYQRRSLPDQVKQATASVPQVIRRPGHLDKVEPVDTPISVTPPEIAVEPAGTAEEVAPVIEPEQVAAVEPEPEPVQPAPTKPPDRMTRMRASFSPGKIAHVADDTPVSAPEGEEPSEK